MPLRTREPALRAEGPQGDLEIIVRVSPPGVETAGVAPGRVGFDNDCLTIGLELQEDHLTYADDTIVFSTWGIQPLETGAYHSGSSKL
jgi:hypothetical protein